MEEELYRKFYEVENAHWWFVARQKIIMDVIEHRIKLPAGSKVLDFGCGTGGVLSALSARFESYGTDMSPLAIEFCRKRGISRAYCCTLDKFPVPGVKFGLITMLDVIEHIDDDEGILRQALGFIEPGGYLIVTVPAYKFLWSSHDDLNHHKRRYTKRMLADVLNRSGFSTLRLSYYNTILFPTALVERMASKVAKSKGDGTLNIPPKPLNTVLARVFESERFLLRRMTFPFGLSLLAVARRPV
ncbi:MAG TPA: class I SAM-dependent methyltransferase [Bacteroidota bacterium]|nr:class I SAM-dependent methyltransferase [Bacteroidota bacterium]